MWPDQLVIALLGLGVASVFIGASSRRRRQAFGVALASIAGVLLFVGPFHEVRLAIFRDALPLAPPPLAPDLTPASCICATRRTLLDMFGRPDFIRASMVGDRYAYWVGEGVGAVIIYHLETREESLGDRVQRIEHRSGVTPSELAHEGLTTPAALPPGR